MNPRENIHTRPPADNPIPRMPVSAFDYKK
jgi:hypothetical protein